jgi:chorismate-pyruvate lyase
MLGGIIEPLNIPDLLAQTKNFPPKLRPLMAVFGTLQGCLSLLFDTPVTVRLLHQERTDHQVKRRVALVAGDTVVATADSSITCTIAQEGYLTDILEGKRGIGELLTVHNITYQTSLMEVSQDLNVCWRTYKISGPGISIVITEWFPKELYQ